MPLHTFIVLYKKMFFQCEETSNSKVQFALICFKSVHGILDLGPLFKMAFSMFKIQFQIGKTHQYFFFVVSSCSPSVKIRHFILFLYFFEFSTSIGLQLGEFYGM
jgi:hypothetical protein